MVARDALRLIVNVVWQRQTNKGCAANQRNKRGDQSKRQNTIVYAVRVVCVVCCVLCVCCVCCVVHDLCWCVVLCGVMIGFVIHLSIQSCHHVQTPLYGPSCL